VREVLGYRYSEEFCLRGPKSHFDLVFLDQLFRVTSSEGGKFVEERCLRVLAVFFLYPDTLGPRLIPYSTNYSSAKVPN